MAIQCDEINQTVNELLIAFQDCNKIKNSDLRLLVELVATVNSCTNGGALYNTQVQDIYTPITDEIVTYPIDTFHSISVMIVSGNIKQTIDSTVIAFPTGTTLNTTVTTLNQYEYTFTVIAGSTIVVEYLIESS